LTCREKDKYLTVHIVGAMIDVKCGKLLINFHCLVTTPQYDILGRITEGKAATLSHGYLWTRRKALTNNACKLVPCQVSHVILAS
jgi:hypothetical protein